MIRHLQSAGASKRTPDGHQGATKAVDALTTADAEVPQNARATPRVLIQRSAGASDLDDSAHQGEWERRKLPYAPHQGTMDPLVSTT